MMVSPAVTPPLPGMGYCQRAAVSSLITRPRMAQDCRPGTKEGEACAGQGSRARKRRCHAGAGQQARAAPATPL